MVRAVTVAAVSVRALDRWAHGRGAAGGLHVVGVEGLAVVGVGVCSGFLAAAVKIVVIVVVLAKARGAGIVLLARALHASSIVLVVVVALTHAVVSEVHAADGSSAHHVGGDAAAFVQRRGSLIPVALELPCPESACAGAHGSPVAS